MPRTINTMAIAPYPRPPGKNELQLPDNHQSGAQDHQDHTDHLPVEAVEGQGQRNKITTIWINSINTSSNLGQTITAGLSMEQQKSGFQFHPMGGR